MGYDEVRKLMDDRGVRRVELRVTDLFGRWQQFAIPAERFTSGLLTAGQGFDGSSLRGFQEIQDSDMLLMPDIETAVYDPMSSSQVPTLAVICDVADPITRSTYSRDPRHIAQKAEEYLRSTGIADTAYFGPESEFFIFDDVRYEQSQGTAFYHLDSVEAHWNSGRDEEPNLAYKIPGKEGYSPVAPFDTLADIRWEMHEAMEAVGMSTEVGHHEVSTAGQGEIATRYATLTRRGDFNQWYKHIVRNVAKRHGKVATFMPKPIFGDNGTGMHTHMSLRKGGEPIFFDANGYAGLSTLARHYVGGLLRHAPAILAFAAPTTNSYKRLVPGFEAPVNLVYSMRNRSAAVRIPTYDLSAEAKRVEFRPPDPSCNAYLAFAAMLMAGIDGIQNQIEPGDPIDRNIYELPGEEANAIPKVPGSLPEAIEALETDHDFLLAGGVFTEDVLDLYLDWKREEISEHGQRPTPYEYEMYFHV